MRNVLVLASIAVILAIGSCMAQKVKSNTPLKEVDGAFGIYIIKGDFGYFTKIPAIDDPNLLMEDKPIISIADIIVYKKDTHEIELVPASYERLKQSIIADAIGGPLFAVCLDKKPIYVGAFWASISSQSFDGVVIRDIWYKSKDCNIIKLSLGYPNEGFFKGEDPRPNSAIFHFLEKAGKLE
jgi:hypothetical protein